MKTKFSVVVKIKKRAVEEIQNAIYAVDTDISKTKENLSAVQDKFKNLLPPNNGSFSALMAYEDMKKAYRYEIDNIKMRLADFINRKNMLLASLREANAELEKMKYLDSEEMQKILRLRAKKESRELDEVGVMLFNNRSES